MRARHALEGRPRLALGVRDVRPHRVEPAATVGKGRAHEEENALHRELGVFQPDVVSISRQTEPPTVTWPVWNSKRVVVEVCIAAEMARATSGSDIGPTQYLCSTRV